MKRIIVNTIFVCLLVCIFASCESEKHWPRKSYVLAYYEYGDIGLRNVGELSYDGLAYVGISVLPEGCRLLSTAYGDWYSFDDGRYLEYCVKHNDFFERPVRNGLSSRPGEFMDTTYPADDIESIRLTAISDWDSVHGAGAVLNGVARIAALSVMPYINAGYTPFDYSCYPQSCFFANFAGGVLDTKCNWYPVDKPLADVTPTELALLGTGDYENQSLFNIYVPKPESEAALELSVKTRSGAVFSAEIKI